MKADRMLAALALAAGGMAHGACLTGTEASELFDHFARKTPAILPAITSEADGACSRARLDALLALQLGRVFGYTAGLTNPAAPKRLGADKAGQGVLSARRALAPRPPGAAALGPRPPTAP